LRAFKHLVAIVGNGMIHDDSAIAERIKAHVMVVAADGGLNHCHRLGIRPDMIVGDCDSANLDLLKRYADVPFRNFCKDKSHSDLDLAVEAIYTPEVEKVTLFGALEGRTDHLLSNLHLIRRYPQKVFLENEKEIVFSFNHSLELPTTPGQIISFIQMEGPVHDVNSWGLKWELHNAEFNRFYFSLSNVCLGKSIKITIGEGDLICVLQKT